MIQNTCRVQRSLEKCQTKLHIFGNIYLTFFQPLATGMQRAGAHSAALAIATQPYSESLSTVESRNVNFFCIDFIYLCLHATESALSETC